MASYVLFTSSSIKASSPKILPEFNIIDFFVFLDVSLTFPVLIINIQLPSSPSQNI